MFYVGEDNLSLSLKALPVAVRASGFMLTAFLCFTCLFTVREADLNHRIAVGHVVPFLCLYILGRLA